MHIGIYIYIISNCLRQTRHRALTKGSVEGCVFDTFRCVFFCCLLFWESFLHDFGVISVSFWCHLGVLGGLLATLGLPGAPPGSRVEKVAEKVVRGSFVGSPLGPLSEPKLAINPKQVVARTTLKNIVRKVLHKRSLGPPPTMKVMALRARNHNFQVYTCTSRVTGNCLQWVPLWHPRSSKIQKHGSPPKSIRKKLCEVIRVSPGNSGNYLCASLKEPSRMADGRPTRHQRHCTGAERARWRV